MPKNPKPHDFDNSNLYRPMSCSACRDCYEIFDVKNQVWTGLCVYGGPFTSYLTDRDYPEEWKIKE